MKTFTVKIIIFVLPLLVFLLPVYFFLRLTGENYRSIDTILNSNKKHLIGYAYNENNYLYLKWKTIIEKDKQQIWALGSSRVLQFRANMFESSFYNSGYTISSITDFLPFLKSIPKQKYPDVLIIGLDQWMFNENWDNLASAKNQQYWKSSFSYSPSANTILSIYQDLINGKYGLSVLSRRYDKDKNIKRFGLNALVNDKGFRNDGSIYYGNQIKMLINGDSLAEDFNYSDTYRRIEAGDRRFQYGDKSNSKAFLELDTLLQFCADNKIFVVGFIPPFASKVRNKMIEMGRYGYIDSIYSQSIKQFKKRNFELWNLENLNDYGSSDNETIDGFHGGELTYIKMLIFMLKNKSILENHTDLENLEKSLSNSKNRYIVYDY